MTKLELQQMTWNVEQRRRAIDKKVAEATKVVTDKAKDADYNTSTTNWFDVGPRYRMTELQIAQVESNIHHRRVWLVKEKESAKCTKMREEQQKHKTQSDWGENDVVMDGRYKS